MSMKQRSSVGTGTGQRGGLQKFDSRQGRKVLCSPSHPGRFCGPHSLLSSRRLGSFLDTEVKGMWSWQPLISCRGYKSVYGIPLHPQMSSRHGA